MYIRQPSGTVLINIPEQKKKQNHANIVASAKTSFWSSLFYKKKTLIKKRTFESFSRY